jgi:ribosomal protein L32
MILLRRNQVRNRKSSHMTQYFSCPNCGADVPLKARACPECGSDEETGWSEAAKYTHLLPYTGDSEPEVSQVQDWRRYAIAAIALLLAVVFLQGGGLGWALPAIALATLAAAAGYLTFRQYTNSSWGMERKLYQQLVNRTRGDRAQAQRLVDYEKRRAPEANRLQLLQNAIYRWDRDRSHY